MNKIQQLQEKEHRLSDRKNRLQVSLNELKNNLTESTIQANFEEILKLELQLELTEKVLENTQEELREQEKYIASKQYKQKLETYQKLQKQAQEQTAGVFKNLVALQKETHSAIKKVEELTQAFREIETDKQKLAYSSPQLKQPFSWLYRTNRGFMTALKRAEYLKDKLEV